MNIISKDDNLAWGCYLVLGVLAFTIIPAMTWYVLLLNIPAYAAVPLSTIGAIAALVPLSTFIFYVINYSFRYMKQRKATINLAWANVFALIFFTFVALISSATWYVLWGTPSFGDFEGSLLKDVNPLGAAVLVLVMLVAGIVAHELIHGITWACFAKHGFRSIRFGVMWAMLTPYCHCKEPLTMQHYRIGGLMPLIILGLLPLLLAYPLKSVPLLQWGIIFVTSAAGDILMIWKLRKEPASLLVQDHPKEAGCIIFEPEVEEDAI